MSDYNRGWNDALAEIKALLQREIALGESIKCANTIEDYERIYASDRLTDIVADIDKAVKPVDHKSPREA